MQTFQKYCLAFFLLIFINSVLFAEIPETEKELVEYLDIKEKIFEDISVQMGTAYWNYYTHEAEYDLETPKSRFVTLFHDQQLIETIDHWSHARENIQDYMVRRRVDLWHNIVTVAKVEKDTTILRLITQLEKWIDETDSTIQRPAKDVLEKKMLMLLKLRNEKARALGYENYADMILEVSELGTDWFNNMIKTVDKATKVPYQKLIEKLKQDQDKKEITVTDVRKMVMQYYLSKRVPEMKSDAMLQILKETIENIGIDYDNLPLRFVEHELPKMVGGQGLAIHIPTDFRTVVLPSLNIRDRFHELGHGLQWMHTNIESPVLKGYEWCFGNDCSAYAEGMAEVIAVVSENPLWLKKYTQQAEKEIERKKAVIDSLAPAFLRFSLATAMFEIELYKDLSVAPKLVRDRLNDKYLLIDVEDQKPKNIANILYISYPVYIQNYMIADMIAWQIHNELQKRFGADYIFNKNVGQYLKEQYWKNGTLYHWQQRLKTTTGRELDVNGYLRSVIP